MTAATATRMTPLAALIAVEYGRSLREPERDSAGPHTVYGSSGEVGRHSYSLVNYPTIVIGRKGSVGNVTYAPAGGWPIDTAFFVRILDAAALDLRYLFWALGASRLESRAITTSIPGLSRDDIYRTRIPLPTLPEQRRIATLLDKADAIRRKRQQAIGLADDLLRSAFLDMFGDPVTNPKGWPTLPIAELAEVITGNTPPRGRSEYYGDAIEWIKSDNINTPSHILTRAVEGLSEAGRALGRAAPEGSTLMTCIAGSQSCIGNVALTDRAVAFNQQINAIVPGPSVDANFLYVQLLLAKPLIQAASTDSMKGMVSKGRLSSVRLPVPASQRQRAFGVWFSGVLSWRLRLDAATAETDHLFDSLVQHSFREALPPGLRQMQ